MTAVALKIALCLTVGLVVGLVLARLYESRYYSVEDALEIITADAIKED